MHGESPTRLHDQPESANLVNNNSNMSPENLVPAMPKLEPSEPRVEPSKSQSKGNEVVNGSNGNFEPQQALAVVNALKADLKQAGLAKPEIQEKVLQLEKWVQGLPTGVNGDKPAIATEEHRKRERQWLLALNSQMRSAKNLDTLFKTTLTEVRQHLQVDRALIYEFQTENEGVVLAESMVAGYTPSLGESLSAIAFGVAERLDYQQQQVVILDRTLPKPLSPYQLQLLQKFQVKGSLTLPMFLEGQVWGLLSLMQCSASRAWRETEITLLHQIVTELTLALQSVEFSDQMQKQAEQAKVINKAKIGRAHV